MIDYFRYIITKLKKNVREILQQCIALGILVFDIFSDKIF